MSRESDARPRPVMSTSGKDVHPVISGDIQVDIGLGPPRKVFVTFRERSVNPSDAREAQQL
jgi:hypothetical protein